MYSLNYKVTTSTCDAVGRLKLFAALQMMQDCSEMWIVSEPTVQRYFEEQHRAQLLAARGVEIVRVPHFKEDLTVTTSVYEVMPKFGFRNTFIYDVQGLPCYKSWSMGAFIDRETATLKSIDQTVIDSLTIEPRLEMDYRDRRIILPKDGGTAFEPVRVMRTDIDYNRHMNNSFLRDQVQPFILSIKGCSKIHLKSSDARFCFRCHSRNICAFSTLLPASVIVLS